MCLHLRSRIIMTLDGEACRRPAGDYGGGVGGNGGLARGSDWKQAKRTDCRYGLEEKAACSLEVGMRKGGDSRMTFR